MPSLHELQTRFMGAVLNPRAAERFGRHLRLNGLRNEQRIQIYRNNMQATLTSALEAVYPVVRRLVGERCFAGVAHEYVRNEPSLSGDIHAYGHRFPDLLAVLPSLRSLPYLSDVARLEWFYHALFHSALQPALRSEALQDVPATQHADLRLQLQSASRLFASDYPVLRIWQVNQVDWSGAPGVSLDEGGEYLLALRGSDGISFIPLEPGEHALLEACAAGQTLADGCTQAFARAADFDLQGVLARHFMMGTFAGWRL